MSFLPITTNAAGTQISTITVTTGAYEKGGTWSPLDGISTITFPTGYVDIPNAFIWWSTSGSSSGPKNHIAMSTATPYSAAYPGVVPVPTEDPGGLQWHLYLKTDQMYWEEFNWLRSAYPTEPWLRCQPTTWFDTGMQPPVAMQAMGLLNAPSRTSPPADTMGTSLTQFLTIATIGGSEAAATVRASEHSTLSLLHSSLLATKSTPVPLVSSAQLTKSFGPMLDPMSSSVLSEEHDNPLKPGGEHMADPKSQSQLFDANSAVWPSTSAPMTTVQRSHVQHLTMQAENAGPSSKVGDTDVSTPPQQEGSRMTPAESTVVLGNYGQARGSTTVPEPPNSVWPPGVASAGDHSIGSISSHATETAARAYGVAGLSVNGGHIIFRGHQLRLKSTVTFGSGSVLTRLALETNSIGQTVLVGDSTTKSGTVSPSLISAESTLAAPSSGGNSVATISNEAASASPTSASIANTATSNVCTTWQYLLATLLAFRFVLLG
ncbi:hypothetical protein LTR37_003399 [Vermiconidia calcicola]|uniref:Uncharacterized protein n=1 Tax=Vermiconidia calcicola TaxID=1690605 RepID=A0ACC3NT03_9PEZI|nr:hypothetical protein LTR37_003399 [Vermiconidia calcicola]